jgi:inorganic phosphate transporter, PiT family
VLIVRRVAGRCACVTGGAALHPSGGAAVAAATRLSVVVDQEAACEQEAPVVAVSANSVSDRLHWLSGGLTSFARGWNDTPKIAALGLLAVPGHEGMLLSCALVTLAMAIGGMVAGRKVLETLASKVTPLPLAESLTASLSTAVLVGMASWNGLPVSTTHVSTGAIIGAGLRNDARGVRWSKVGEIVLSWVITLPAAGLHAALVALVVR